MTRYCILLSEQKVSFWLLQEKDVGYFYFCYIIILLNYYCFFLLSVFLENKTHLAFFSEYVLIEECVVVLENDKKNTI